MTRQASREIMMVRPKHFGFDETTAESNSFQNREGAEQIESISKEALSEFDAAVFKLRANGVKVHVIEDTDSPVKPNAVFPNNWVSFHGEQTLLYPMLAENRRWERRTEILDELASAGVSVGNIVDLTAFEEEGKFLESTGSMVLDYENELAYACISSRTNIEVVEEFCNKTGFDAFTFDSFDKEGLEVYHTNVIMCVAAKYAVICLESIPDEQHSTVIEALEKTGHEIIPLTMDQMYSFAGNMLEVLNDKGESTLVMSQSAFDCLTKDQIVQIEKYSNIFSVEIPTIEKYGGGSVRCMMCRVV
ncbi:citrulline utilization hydrolase CtlX [Roseivirga sp. E12]|uniref:citrulline utilization hydrolase CtlX n=1 Tax=Roseivirga sp. E12 TaxID=2819237 RepID=UPI001F3A7285|nr:arginine deiminase-related protein [Roseivirga sp. E12]